MTKLTLLLVACAALGGCAPVLERQLVFHPFYEARTGTLWLIEKDTRVGSDDQIAVVVCQREAAPACVRVLPFDAQDGAEYSLWLNSMPPAVRRAISELEAPEPAAAAPAPRVQPVQPQPEAAALAPAQPAEPVKPALPAGPPQPPIPDGVLTPAPSIPRANDNPY